MKNFINSLILLGIGGLSALVFSINANIGRETIWNAMLGITILFVIITAYKIGQIQNMICHDEVLPGLTKIIKFVKEEGGYILIYLIAIAILALLYYLSMKVNKNSH
jgi:hypothetical protein